jgi:uncharacterized protein (DUF1800 family)
MQPVYTEAQVQAFARAYTGWTYATATGTASIKFPNGTANYDSPMAALESAHDTGAKILLTSTLPAGQTAEQDLADLLRWRRQLRYSLRSTAPCREAC